MKKPVLYGLFCVSVFGMRILPQGSTKSQEAILNSEADKAELARRVRRREAPSNPCSPAKIKEPALVAGFLIFG
jgi:hypothetical protein